jgi:uncharacterized protein YjbJ (UPF0337 family)
MDENEVKGAAENLAGKAGESIGAVTGDATTKLRGKTKRAAGTADRLSGQASDLAAGLLEDARSTIETKPYTAVAIALALGWLFGRSHRPL